jgi:UDPglucose 6-dehydrogenase
MNITVIGAGYVGLVTAVCFAELGNQVTCVDIDASKIDSLNKSVLPVYEPGLDAMVKSGLSENRLHFVTSLTEQIHSPEVIFIAVGTPQDTDGSADMRYVLKAAEDIGASLTKYCVVVDKSTVPVGVADQVREVVGKGLAERGLSLDFDVVSNPEFLREGGAIEDFMNPDRIVIGLTTERARGIMQELYRPILHHPEKLYFMTVRDAEMTKYVANAMLATRISFMNEMSLLCDAMGVDIENVRRGIGADSRIGPSYLYPGCGYGGSCFPKDVKALIYMAEKHGLSPFMLHAVEERNRFQKQVLVDKTLQRFGNDLTGIHVGLWGLSFKPGTDDMREATSLVVIDFLLSRGATVSAYDPVAMPAARKQLPDVWFTSGKLAFASHQYEALTGADALILVTEWKSFCYPDLAAMKDLMRQRIIFDGRNQYHPAQMTSEGFEHYGIGRGNVSQPEFNDAVHATRFRETAKADDVL